MKLGERFAAFDAEEETRARAGVNARVLACDRAAWMRGELLPPRNLFGVRSTSS